jgi:hypothetical protein
MHEEQKGHQHDHYEKQFGVSGNHGFKATFFGNRRTIGGIPDSK